VLIQLLREKRKAQRLSLEVVAARMPPWSHFDFSRLGRVERGTRDVTYQELREIAKAIGTSITELVGEVESILAAKSRVDRPRRKR
jgi:transcriptional regulator with XRE-family HTH domain